MLKLLTRKGRILNGVAKLVGLLTLFLCFHSAQGAQSVQLAWDAEDGIAGYNIYYGTVSGSHPIHIDAGTNTTLTVTGLQEGLTYYFVITAYDAQGLESDPSDEISYLVPGILEASMGTTNNVFSLRFPVATSHWYELQGSTNLTDWSTVWQTPAATSNCWVQFNQAKALKSQFFRVVLH